MADLAAQGVQLLRGGRVLVREELVGQPSSSERQGGREHLRSDPAGRLIWASDALPGAVHDLTAARTHGIPAAVAANAIKCWADKAYQGADPAVRVPFRGKNLRGWRRRHNLDHAKIRGLGGRAMATLKCWRLLRKLRCSTTRITAIVRAVVALELAA
ncbi:transposase family protein [Streptomyces sp. NPDC089424]|uniref:transposase family protein n=1 Tax=Streptomyces sp. NPDC089424 TaxID=3365917 RepID=UPI003813F646